MKKTILIIIIIYILVFPCQAFATENSLQKTSKQNTNLKEIVLNVDSNNNLESKVFDNPPLLEGYTRNRPEQHFEETEPQDLNLTPYQAWVKNFSEIFTLRGGIHKHLQQEYDEANSTKEKTVVQQWLDGDFATGKWFGARPLLEEHGLVVNSGLLYTPATKIGGGGANDASSTKGSSLFNLSVSVDTKKAGGWDGGTFYMLYQRKNGYGLTGSNTYNGALGDWMGYDGWDSRQLNQISELWFQQKLFKEKLRLKVGKQDANTDFGYLNTGWDFMNLALSVNPTTPMPTYPDQTFGFVAEISPKEWLSIKNGIYSKFNTPFNITEILVKPKTKLPGRYMIGAWEWSDSTGMSVPYATDSSGASIYNNFNRNYGAYAGFEQMVYKENKKDNNDMQGLTLLGQAGISPSNKNDMSKYISAGLHYIGPIPHRDKDRIGIAMANGTFAPRLGDVGTDYGIRTGSETVFEAFYRIQVNNWFYLQPDVQFIMNPGGMYQNAIAIGLRSVITF